MIKLTLKSSDNHYIYINTFQIVCFYSDKSNGSIIEMTRGENIQVTETPEEIQKLIEKELI